MMPHSSSFEHLWLGSWMRSDPKPRPVCSSAEALAIICTDSRVIAQLCGLDSVPESSKAQEWLAAIPDERAAAEQLAAWAATITDTSLLSDEAARSLLSSPGEAGPARWHLDTTTGLFGASSALWTAGNNMCEPLFDTGLPIVVGVEPNLAAIPEPLQQLVDPLEKAVTEAGTPQECRSLLEKAAIAAKASTFHTAFWGSAFARSSIISCNRIAVT